MSDEGMEYMYAEYDDLAGELKAVTVERDRMKQALTRCLRQCTVCGGQGLIPRVLGELGEFVEYDACDACRFIREALSNPEPESRRQYMLVDYIHLRVDSPDPGALPDCGRRPYSMSIQWLQETDLAMSVVRPPRWEDCGDLQRFIETTDGSYSLSFRFVMMTGSGLQDFKFRGVDFDVSCWQSDGSLREGQAISARLSKDEVTAFFKYNTTDETAEIQTDT